MINTARIRFAAAVILIVSSSIYSSIVMFMKAQPSLLEPFALSRTMTVDRQFEPVREALPSHGVIGYHFGHTFNKPAVRKLIASEAFKEAYMRSLETGEPMDERIADVDAFRILQTREAALYQKFIQIQFAMAPLVLVTKSFGYFEDIVLYSEQAAWDLEEYPDLVVGDFRGIGARGIIEIPEGFKETRRFMSRLILLEREK